MGSLTVEQIVTVDGYAAAPDGGLDFFGDMGGADADREQLGFLQDVDAILLGANTYRMFAAYWPDADPQAEPVAVPIRALPKFVFSHSLSAAPWGDGAAEIVGGTPQSAVATLKERHRHIIVWGSLQLTSALWEAGVVDRLRLRVVPTLLGVGRSFTPPSLGATTLDLQRVLEGPQGRITLDYRVMP